MKQASIRFTIILSTLFYSSLAQIGKPLCVNPMLPMDTVSQSKGWTYFETMKEDTLIIIGIKEGIYYEERRGNGKLLQEGTLLLPLAFNRWLTRHGKWAEYHTNGRLKALGFYEKDEPIGLWEHFHENGQRKTTFQYNVFEHDKEFIYLKSGPYEEFYPNGNPKCLGQFRARIVPTETTAMNPENGKQETIRSQKWETKEAGLWHYFDAQGNLIKKINHE